MSRASRPHRSLPTRALGGSAARPERAAQPGAGRVQAQEAKASGLWPRQGGGLWQRQDGLLHTPSSVGEMRAPRSSVTDHMTKGRTTRLTPCPGRRHRGLQPPARRAAASSTQGCSLQHAGLQPLARKAAASSAQGCSIQHMGLQASRKTLKLQPLAHTWIAACSRTRKAAAASSEVGRVSPERRKMPQVAPGRSHSGGVGEAGGAWLQRPRQRLGGQQPGNHSWECPEEAGAELGALPSRTFGHAAAPQLTVSSGRSIPTMARIRGGSSQSHTSHRGAMDLCSLMGGWVDIVPVGKEM